MTSPKTAGRLRLVPLLLLFLSLLCPASAPAEGLFEEAGADVFAGVGAHLKSGSLNQAGVEVFGARELARWACVSLDFRLEAQFGHYWGKSAACQVSLLPGIRAYLQPGRSWSPYLEGGIGPSLNDLDVEELGTVFNFVSFAGVGLRLGLGDGKALEMGYRFQHISNAGLDEENHGVNGHQARLGLVWFF